MSDEDSPTDIRPGHFAKRDSDRGNRGALLRLFDALDPARQQELLDFAASLTGKPGPAGG